MLRIALRLAAAVLIVGCAARPDIGARSAEDPASPQATEGQVPAVAPPLSLEPVPAAASGTDCPQSDDAGMPGMEMKGTAASGTGHDSASATTGPATRSAERQQLYTCKMHPKVISDRPGNCPICGMKLIPKAGAK